ncbi:hypothetical protein Godav_023941 [Gossypium davidsonii]|uniref:Uncharacterized protein n=1 Tax=Gossypium davidsonii TaxID=34287 RepID=A0A7J8STC6_GOSDV|nr:hypothetical protein [Gossypium davidsonii]
MVGYCFKKRRLQMKVVWIKLNSSVSKSWKYLLINIMGTEYWVVVVKLWFIKECCLMGELFQ